MRITVGNVLLGDYDEDIPIGGLNVSGEPVVNRGRGTCTGLERLRKNGARSMRMTVPTKRTFESVAEAQRWMLETGIAGGYEGILSCELADSSSVSVAWAVATPSDLTHRGVLVSATWSIEAGERLT
jgi:hypothetical protein